MKKMTEIVAKLIGDVNDVAGFAIGKVIARYGIGKYSDDDAVLLAKFTRIANGAIEYAKASAELQDEVVRKLDQIISRMDSVEMSLNDIGEDVAIVKARTAEKKSSKEEEFGLPDYLNDEA